MMSREASPEHICAGEELQTVIDARELPYAGLGRETFWTEQGWTKAGNGIVGDWFFSDLDRLDQPEAVQVRPLLRAMIAAISALSELADGMTSANAALRGVDSPAVYHDCLQCGQKWLPDAVLPHYQQKYRLMLMALSPFRTKLSELVDAAVAADDVWQAKLESASGLSAQLEAHLAHAVVDEQLRGHVYLIENPARAIAKIGYSANPQARLATLLTSSPDELVIRHSFPGSPADERALHRRFAAHRIRREWFRLDPTILSEFAKLEEQRVAKAASEQSDVAA